MSADGKNFSPSPSWPLVALNGSHNGRPRRGGGLIRILTPPLEKQIPSTPELYIVNVWPTTKCI